MKGLTYDRGVLMVKPGILISLPVPKELTLRPFFYLVITEYDTNQLQRDREPPYYDSHYLSKS